MIYAKGRENIQQPVFKDIRDLLHKQVESHGGEPIYAYRLKPRGETIFVSYAQFEQDVQALGTAVMALGLLQVGEKAAVLGENSYAWAMAHTAIMCGLGISVPLDRQLAPGEVESLCQRSRARVFFVDEGSRKLIPHLRETCPSVTTFVLLHAPEVELPEEEDPCIFTLGQLLREGRRRLEEGDTGYTSLPIDDHACAGLYFTSGTTSQSKGVMLSHRAILANFRNGLRSLQVKPGSRTLSVLPLHHTFENTVGMFAQWSIHNCIYFNDGLRYFAYNMKDWHIEIILAVPLLLESMYKQMQLGIKKAGKVKKVKIAMAVTNFLFKLGIDVRRKVFKDILEPLGGSLKLIIAGAAALAPEISRFLYGIGIDCMLGYGLTEAGPMLAANNQWYFKPGTVGQPLADNEIKIDNGLDYSDADHPGEVLGKTECMMIGYYEDPEATAEALDSEGWLHTGDIGYLDEDACLHLTGRLKSMIVLTNGKKVFPEEIESLLGEIPGVKASFVWGEDSHRGTVDPCASLLVDLSLLPAELHEAPAEEVGEWLHKRIAEVNEKMPVYKAIRYFLWSKEGMPLTTTLKVRRQLEKQRIEAYLRTAGKTMREADRSRLQ